MDMTLRILLAVGILVLAGCASVGPHHADDTAWRDARQLVLVTTADWEATTGTLRTFARGDDGAWHEAGKAAPVSIGRGGSGWGLGLHPAQTGGPAKRRSEEHTSELQSLMRISYAVFCLKKKKANITNTQHRAQP